MSGTAHHGKTPAAWTGVIISFIGFCVAGAFMVMADPVPFWIGIGLTLLGPVVGGLMSAAGLGAVKHDKARAAAQPQVAPSES